MENKEKYQQPSPIVRNWEMIRDDMKPFIQNPYSWIADELKKSPSRIQYGRGSKEEWYDTLMEILELINSIYSPTENHSH